MKPLGSAELRPVESHSNKLINLLSKRGCLDKEGLALVSRLQRQSRGRSIPTILVDAGVDEESVQQAVAEISNLPFAKIELQQVITELVKRLGLGWCKEHTVLPVSIEGKKYLASISIDELFLTDDIRLEVGFDIGQMLTTRRDIISILNTLEEESKLQNASCTTQEYDASFYAADDDSDTVDLEEAAADADSSPVVRLVGEMITRAVREEASDVHFEAGDECSHIRFRIDGVLHELMESPNRLHGAVVSRIKILANLDIAERRLPQDGRIRATVLGRPIDLRVSTVPTPKGEKIVIRLLDDRNIRIGLDELGFREESLASWKHEISSPHGIILVTGPTGCGKTTTLYAFLSRWR